MFDYLDKSLIKTQPVLLTIDNTKQLLHCFSSTDVDTVVSLVVANIPLKGYGIFHFAFIYRSAKWTFLEYPK